MGGVEPTVFKKKLEPSSERAWWLLLAFCLAAAHLLIIIPLFLQEGRPPMRADSAIFQYSGWYMAEGAALYTEIWDVKPPLPHLITGGLAILTGGDPLLHHIANVLLTLLVSVGTGLLVYRLVDDEVEDRFSAFLAGLSILLLPGFYYLPAFGFKAKFYVIFFGLLSIWLSKRDRHVLAGFSAAASVATYQAALIFPVIAAVFGYRMQGARGVARAGAGGTLLAILTVLPIAFQGGLEAMFSEAVLIPMILTDPGRPILARITSSAQFFGPSAPAVLLGGAGLLLGVRQRGLDQLWWVLMGSIWFGLVTLFVDFDSYPDLIPGMAFVAIGVGLLAASNLDGRFKRVTVGLVLFGVLLNLVAILAFGGLISEYPISSAEPPSDLENYEHEYRGYSVERPHVKYQYWNEVQSGTCHIRFSTTEMDWLRMTGKPVIDENCGRVDMYLEYL